MGIFTGLLTLPLAPLRGVVWVAEQVLEEMDSELYDEDNIRREMVQLELDSEDGLIDDDERQAREEALLDRLAIGQARSEMLQLELDFEDGLIDDDERQAREEALLDTLALSQARSDVAADEENDDG